MNLPARVDDFAALADLRADLHLAIGVFDGVHLGHKAVIESAIVSAKRGGISAVLTFDPHPSRLFRPEAATRLIMPIDTKVAKLWEFGVDCVICKRFDHAFAAISAEGFLAHLKAGLPTLKAIYVGENFRFGQKRIGDVDTLVETGRSLGLGVFSAERIKHNGEPISSTRIRGEIEAGRIEQANDLLGENYRSSGVVVSGARLGRQLGFPTLNLPWDPECRPCFGVYHVRFRESGAATWCAGVANYGVKPTVAGAGQPPVLEVHGLQETLLGTGAAIDVEWLRFIRPEEKFASLEDLKAQIAKDREIALSWS